MEALTLYAGVTMIGLDTAIKGQLQSRYKRFFVDIQLDAQDTFSPNIITAHCPNPGKMLGLLTPGTEALVTPLNDPKRKLQYRLEALKEDGVWVGVNTQWPNRLIGEAIAEARIPALSGYAVLRPEVRYGHNSRIDWLASGHATRADAFIEVKNVHLKRHGDLAEFPDCVTERGAKHLYELIEMVQAGYRAVVVFCVQRDDVARFDVARDLDPKFALAYAAARAAGVEIEAHAFRVDDTGIRYSHALSVI